jgi:hypothetical protein
MPAPAQIPELHDFTWTDTPPPSEPVSGMSESLARGLVTRFSDEWRRADIAALLRHPAPETQKRAAAYRANCAWLLRSVPPSLQVMTVRSGPQNGVDKAGRFVLFHWQPDERENWLYLVAQCVRANRPGVEEAIFALVSQHALMRVFMRLKTDDPRVVLDELATGVETYWDLGAYHKVALGRPVILLPTRRGAALVAPRQETPTGVFWKTWMTDERMQTNPRRLRAVERARAEHGFVLMVDGRYAVFSKDSLRQRSTQEAIQECVRRAVEAEADAAWAAQSGRPPDG